MYYGPSLPFVHISLILFNVLCLMLFFRVEVGAMTWNPKWEEERPKLRAQHTTRLDALERWFVNHRR